MSDLAAPAADAAPVRTAMDRRAWSWALYEFGRNPYVVLCTIYIFAPFVATVFIGDPVQGQIFVASASKFAGLVVAVTAPFLGAAADGVGARKPLLATLTGALIACMGLLWFAAPDGSGLDATQLFALMMALGVLFAWSETIHNAMLPGAAGAHVAETSGAGLALGNAASVLLLTVVLLFLAMPGRIDFPFVADAPALGLDPALNEPERFVGPLVAMWFAVFALPLFLFVPDLERTGIKAGAAIGGAFAAVWRTVREVARTRDLGLFLLARMLYADGKTALLIFGGVYAAGVMQWGMAEMAAQGIWLSIWATLGGFLAGPMDRALGPRNSVILALTVTLAAMAVQIGTTPTTLLYVIEVGDAPVWNGPLFTTLPELFYMGVTSLIAVFVTSCYASSRTLLVALAPPDRIASLFGLYALSGTATVWAGPLLVELFTRTFQSQQAGMAGVAILLVSGLLLLLTVRAPRLGST